MPMNLEQARTNMVENQVRPWEVLDAQVLEILGQLRREDFVPERYKRLAFADMALPLGHGEVMMKPLIEGRLLQALSLQPHERVLEIGTGSGFVTACLARLASEVVSVEQHADFAEAARERLASLAINNVRIEVAEAVHGFTCDLHFDVVVVTGAVHTVPERFRSWVKPGGRMFVISGDSPAMEAAMHTRADANHWQVEGLFETDMPYLNHAAPPQRFTL